RTMKFNAIKLGSLPASVVPARSGFTCRRGFKLGRTHRRPDRVLPASYLFGVVAARANGARTLVRRKVGWRRGLEITLCESAVPAFLRDKSRAPGPFLVRERNTYPASRWQNLPARCRQHSGGLGAMRAPGCFSLIRLFTRFALLIATCLPARAATPEPFELHDGDRVLFIGDTFFEREVDYGHIETRLTAAFPERNITFRNLAWAADTPMGRSRASFDWSKPEEEWLKRVKEQAALAKPTVAFLSYGMTASLDGEAGISKFTADMNKLMDAVDEVSGSPAGVPRKVRFVLLGPIRHEEGHGTDAAASRHNASLKRYNDALKNVAASRGAFFVELFGHRVNPADKNAKASAGHAN